jgi:hypothetical protein
VDVDVIALVRTPRGFALVDVIALVSRSWT